MKEFGIVLVWFAVLVILITDVCVCQYLALEGPNWLLAARDPKQGGNPIIILSGLGTAAFAISFGAFLTNKLCD